MRIKGMFARIGVQTNRSIRYNERQSGSPPLISAPKSHFLVTSRRKCYFNSATTAFPFVSSCKARKFKKWGKFAIKALNMSFQKTYLSFKLYLSETWISEVTSMFTVKIKSTGRHYWHARCFQTVFSRQNSRIKISLI